jgi:hypothetical protein
MNQVAEDGGEFVIYEHLTSDEITMLRGVKRDPDSGIYFVHIPAKNTTLIRVIDATILIGVIITFYLWIN